ncbi:MAG: hypothetical protein K6G58_04205 [Lachnospiraceae bacterium]|nr:hypothetical protein [Lachnospiraceae bacterium]
MNKLAEHYAHRGFHDKPRIPENSMAAFENAVKHGFPVEFDVHLLSDGGLAVFHDEDLGRETGESGRIEDESLESLGRFRLEGTDERIPAFDEVLDLFEGTGLPLLIELKASRGNHKSLADAVCERLKRYKGEYVIESFDPRVLMEVRKIAGDTAVGQLSQDFIRNREGLSFYQAVILTNMMFNVKIRPEFIAYRFEDVNRPAARSAIKRGIPAAVWTIRNIDDYRRAKESGMVPIFEQFNPGAMLPSQSP